MRRSARTAAAARSAVVAEEPSELRERLEVTAIGESRDAEGMPGAGGHEPAFGRIDGGERPGRMLAGRAGVGAQSEDGGGDDVSGRGNEFHLVRLGHAGRLGGGVQRLVPAPGVDVCPSEHGQASAAGAPYAGSADPLHGVLQQTERQIGFVQDPGGGSYSPQGGLFNGRVGDLAQVGAKLVSAADRVGAGVYPESQHVDINARDRPTGRWTLTVQQAEGPADGLAAGGRSGLVGDSGGTCEGVPGEGRLVARRLFGDGDEG
jgi:hypothetical protein